MAVSAPDQRTLALSKANRVRSQRARLLSEMRSLPRPESAAMLVDVLADPPEFLLSMRVVDLVAGVRRVGPVKARIMLASVGPAPVSPVRLVGDLTLRQRRELQMLVGGAKDV